MLYALYLNIYVLHLWFDDAHVDSMEQGLLSTWRDAHGVICDYLLFFLWHLHCIICIHWHMELCRCLLAAIVPVQHRLLCVTMRLHTLLGMKAGDMAFALHMHYNFGLWHHGLGLRLWMSSWEAMLLQGLLVINLYHGWSCINCWTHLIAYCWLTYKWGLNWCLMNL